MVKLCSTVVVLLALNAMPVGYAEPAAIAAPGRQRPRASVAAKKPATKPAASSAEKQELDCGCEASAPPGVLALVNGVKIAISEVEDPLKDKIQELQNQVIAARQRELEIQISKRLFAVEAKRRVTTPEKLVQRELAGKVKDPTEPEVQAFYEQNRARIQGDYTEARDSIVSYMREQRIAEETMKLAQRLAPGRVQMFVKKVLPPRNAADRAKLLAIVNGHRIASGDIEESLSAFVFSVQEQVYALRKKQLDAKINDLLLTQEANKKETTVEALFDAEVTSKTRKVTDDEIQNFYQDNKERIGRPLYQSRAEIQALLQDQLRTAAVNVYAEQLRANAKVQVFLKPPDPPFLKIAIEDQPWKGPPNAPVTIVEFTDYECPSCANTQPVIEEAIKPYADKVKLVVRDFPLSQHEHAFKAAVAAEAARAQGKYWEYAELLFKNQKALEVENLKNYASQLGLDRAKFDEALNSDRLSENVKLDIKDGLSFGVDSTPTVFINGKRVREKTAEGLRAAIEAALKQKAPAQ